MFSESHVERATSLSNIFFVARRACQLVYYILVKFVWFWVLHFNEFSQVIVCGICHYKRRVFETFLMYLAALPINVNMTHICFWFSCSCLCICFVFLPILFRSDVLYLLL